MKKQVYILILTIFLVFTSYQILAANLIISKPQLISAAPPDEFTADPAKFTIITDKTNYNLGDEVVIGVYVESSVGKYPLGIIGPDLSVYVQDGNSQYLDFNSPLSTNPGQIFTPLKFAKDPLYREKVTGDYYGYNFAAKYESKTINSKDLVFSITLRAQEVGSVTLNLVGEYYDLDETSYVPSATTTIILGNCGNRLCEAFETASSCPEDCDQDKDGLADDVETGTGTFIDETDTGTDPNNPDTDGDGIDDGTEVAAGTDPNNPDTDDDNLKDGVEDANQNGVLDPGETDPLNPDTDGDNIEDDVDECPLENAAGQDQNQNGCIDSLEDVDKDRDGVPDDVDNCPLTPPGAPTYYQFYPTQYWGCIKGDIRLESNNLPNDNIDLADHTKYLSKFFQNYNGDVSGADPEAQASNIKNKDLAGNTNTVINLADHTAYLTNFFRFYNYNPPNQNSPLSSYSSVNTANRFVV